MMRPALLEVLRVPRRFVPMVSTLATIVFLALSVSGLADGLLRASTGSLRNTDADLFVFADGAQRSVMRSMLPEVLAIPITHQAGVAAAGGMGFVPTSVRAAEDGPDEPVVAVSVSHALPGQPRQLRAGRLPFDGEPRVVAIDERLTATGLGLGDRLEVDGAFSATVVGVVRDASYLLRPTIWLPPAEFATVRNAALPEFDVDEALTSVITVRLTDGAVPARVVEAIHAAFEEALTERDELADVAGGIEVVTARAAYRAIPGVASQQATLRAIVVTVLLLAAAVVALFLALLAVERRPLLAGLVAAGVPARRITTMLAIQAAACGVAGTIAGSLAALVLVVLAPATVPFAFTPGSLALVWLGTPAAAVTGALASGWSLRRLEPATEVLGVR